MTITFEDFKSTEPGIIAKWIVKHNGEQVGLTTKKIHPENPREYLFTFWQDWDEEKDSRPGPVRVSTLDEAIQAAKEADYV